MRIGFIGAGNMASAIIKGILLSEKVPADQIYVSDVNPDACNKFCGSGVRICANNKDLVCSVDCVVLAIKPVYADDVVREVYDELSGKFVISIIGSWAHDKLGAALPDSTRFVRVMPNTPLAVGEGMSLIGQTYTCTQEELEFTKEVFSASGKVCVIEDHAFTAASGISGCGPAFVYQFIEALADGGVRYGVPRATAYELAAQTLIGAARMVLKSHQHPGALKDAVCSPGGTTIEGVYALERGGMRAAVIDAISATVQKTAEMNKK